MPVGEVADWWATSISDISPGVIRYRGYPVEEMIAGLSYAQTVWLMLFGELPRPWHARLLEATLVAGIDHGPQAPSIAAARIAATCGVGLNSSVATGVNLLGDVHGGAGEQCVDMLQDVLARADHGSELAMAAAHVVGEIKEAGGYVPGFGHRFHPHDPRRDTLLGLVDAAAQAGEVGGRHRDAALAIEACLNEGRTRPIPMNIDGATAVVHAELGVPAPLSRGLFVLSRSVGILAHAWEQTQQGGRNKGPIPRTVLPSYTGAPSRHIPSRDGEGEG
jgi:citrate synthase